MFTKKVLRIAVSSSAVTALLLSSVHILSHPTGDVVTLHSNQNVNQAVRPPVPGRVDEESRHAASPERVIRTRHYSAPAQSSFIERFFQFNIARLLRRNDGQVPAGGTSPLVPNRN